MRWTIKFLLACASLPLVPLAAQEGAPPPAPAPGQAEERAADQPPAPAPDMWSHVLERFDRNGDGAITKEDFEGMKAPARPGRGPMGPGARQPAGPGGPGPQAEDLRELARELFQEHPRLRQWMQQRRGGERGPRARRGEGPGFGQPGRMRGRGQMGPRGMGPGELGRGQRGRGGMGPGMRGRGPRGQGGMGRFGGVCPQCGQPCPQGQMRGQQQPFGPGFGPPPWAGRRR